MTSIEFGILDLINLTSVGTTLQPVVTYLNPTSIATPFADINGYVKKERVLSLTLMDYTLETEYTLKMFIRNPSR
jgi:hypothetical protein